MKRFIATLIVLVATYMFMLVGIWLSPYAIGWIGYLFDMAKNSSDTTNLYVGVLVFFILVLAIITIVFLTFKKTRVYSLFTIPHLLALLFVAPFSANGIEYKGHGYTYLRGYPFHCNGMRTLTGKVIFQTYSYDVNLVYDKQGIPVFFLYESDSYSGLGRCKIWDLKGNFLFDPEKFTMIDYHNEWVYTISVEKKYEISLDNIGEKYPYNRVSFRLYDFEGNYIK